MPDQDQHLDLDRIKHDAIVVTSDSFILASKSRDAAEGLGLLVSPIVQSLHKYCSFMIAPDGAVEGRPASDHADRARMLWAKEHTGGCEWVAVHFGGGTLMAGISLDQAGKFINDVKGTSLTRTT